MLECYMFAATNRLKRLLSKLLRGQDIFQSLCNKTHIS